MKKLLKASAGRLNWGKLISIDGTLKDTVGVKNPYRYRVYRYDTETGLYYCQSRYFNPEWGRWLNADGIVAITGALLSANMFAYCMNNPVNSYDPSGYMFEATLRLAGNIFQGATTGAAEIAGGVVIGVGLIIGLNPTQCNTGEDDIVYQQHVQEQEAINDALKHLSKDKNKINKIKNPKHDWDKIIKGAVTWAKIYDIIKKVMNDGI